MSDKRIIYKSSSLSTIVFIVFLILKLTGTGEISNWSWWWVTSPLWFPWVFIFTFILILFITIFLIGFIKAIIDN